VPDGWAIWIRAQPTAPILRFGAGEQEKAWRLFVQLELLEGRASTGAVPGQRPERPAPPEASDSEGLEPLPPPPYLGPSRALRTNAALTRLATGVIVVAFVAALAAIAALVTLPRTPGVQTRAEGSIAIPTPAGSRPASSDPSSENSPDDAPGVPGVRVYANTAGGYLFSYPGSWTVTDGGTDAVLTSPDGTVQVVFGRTPGRSLSRSSDLLVEQVMRSHAGVEVLSSSRESTEQGLRTVLVGGTVDETERFLAISVEGDGDNKAITVFFPQGRQPPQVLRAIRAVIASYRVSTEA